MNSLRMKWQGSLALSLIVPAQSLVAQDWIATSAPMTNWAAVACSADGSKLVAAVGVLLEPGPAIPGPIYISSDFGSTWTPSMAPIMNWDALACSADGSKVLAAVGRKDWHNPGPICLS